jgi:hypothetical protein
MSAGTERATQSRAATRPRPVSVEIAGAVFVLALPALLLAIAVMMEGR